MRGDLVLFKAAPYNVWDWIIAKATGGPFVHVEIDIGNNEFIGALNKGVDRHGGASGPGIVRVPIKANAADIESGIAWLELQVGLPYGWTDIFSSGIHLIGTHINISRDGQFDCSDLATRYLLIARAAGPLGGLALHPESVSPNDIARAFNVKG